MSRCTLSFEFDSVEQAAEFLKTRTLPANASLAPVTAGPGVTVISAAAAVQPSQQTAPTIDELRTQTRVAMTSYIKPGTGKSAKDAKEILNRVGCEAIAKATEDQCRQLIQLFSQSAAA